LQVSRRMVPLPMRQEGLDPELRALLAAQASDAARVRRRAAKDRSLAVLDEADLGDRLPHPVLGDLAAMKVQLQSLLALPATRDLLRSLLDPSAPVDVENKQQHTESTRVDAEKCEGMPTAETGSSGASGFAHHQQQPDLPAEAGSPYRSAATNTSLSVAPLSSSSSSHFRISTGTSTQFPSASSTTQTPWLAEDPEEFFSSAVLDTPDRDRDRDSPGASVGGDPMSPGQMMHRSDFCGDTDDMPLPFLPRPDIPSSDFCGGTHDTILWPHPDLSSSATNTEPPDPDQGFTFPSFADDAVSRASSSSSGFTW